MNRRSFVAIALCLTVAAAGAAQPQGDKDSGRLGILFDKGFGGGNVHSMRFGLHVLDDQGKRTGKKLTFHAAGLTSNTCVKIDGKEYLFGEQPGKWRVKEAALGKGRAGVRSVWEYPEGVTVTQLVEIVRGEQTGLLDTCSVEYVLENESAKPHQVGIRFLLDTMIGSNDGAPFIVPGAAALVETSADYKGEQVPPFVQALESLDFKKPGVVATLKLKLGGDVEAPGRVTLGGWPAKESKQPGANDGLTLWNVPVFSIKALNDGAAVLYWPEQKLGPKQQRRVGFAYGLGAFTANDKGNLGLIVDGVPAVGRELTVVALRGRRGRRHADAEIADGTGTREGAGGVQGERRCRRGDLDGARDRGGQAAFDGGEPGRRRRGAGPDGRQAESAAVTPVLAPLAPFRGEGSQFPTTKIARSAPSVVRPGELCRNLLDTTAATAF